MHLIPNRYQLQHSTVVSDVGECQRQFEFVDRGDLKLRRDWRSERMLRKWQTCRYRPGQPLSIDSATDTIDKEGARKRRKI